MSEQLTKNKADQLKARAALFSLLAAVFLTTLKLGVGVYTNSLALLSEALHSGLDLVAALMTWYAIRISAKPADRRHPYGHGKMENLSALAETVLLFLVCAYVGYEGAHRLMEGSSPVIPSLWGVGVMLISMAVDINRVRNLRKVARETNSQALEADALHFSTDILSSAVVFLGVLAVWLADVLALPPHIREVLHQADTVAAIVVALIIFKVSLTMARRALDFLMDAAPEDAEERIEKAVLAVRGVNSLTRLRMRSAGPDYFVDLSVGVDPGLRVSEGHKVASEVERAVQGLLPQADVLVHVDPYRGSNRDDSIPGVIEYEAGNRELDLHDLRVLRRDDGTTCVTAHVEFDGRTSFGRAYERCKAFEAAVRRKCNGVEILTHLEPRSAETSARAMDVKTDRMAALLWQGVQECVAKERLLVSEPHGFSCHTEPSLGLVLHFHCLVSGMLSVKDVHDLTQRMEETLRKEFPLIGSILIHMEPKDPGMQGCREDLELARAAVEGPTGGVNAGKADSDNSGEPGVN